MKSLLNSYSLLCLILSSILLLPSIASAEVGINTTLEDNLVILLDYSGSTGIGDFRKYIQSDALYSIQNIENDSNVSVVVYGGFIKSTELYRMDNQENRDLLKEFILNITGKNGDIAYDNIRQGFEEARKILYNSTGSKQIVLISDGNLDGKFHEKLNDALIDLVKEVKKDNITINLYQVSTAKLSPTLKITSIREPYKDLGDKLNTEVVVLNPDEKILFLRIKSHTATVPKSSELVDLSQTIASKSVDILSERDEYLNEFSDNGETSLITSVMYYDQKDYLSTLFHLSKPSEVHFYSYCNQTCIVVPFDVEQRIFFDERTLEDVFKNKDAIELVTSGRVTESAYTFSIGMDACDYYGSDVLKKESTNLGGEIASSALPEKNAKLVKKIIPKPNFIDLGISAACYKVSSDEGEVFNKISEGRIYTTDLKNGYVYYGIVEDFQETNIETIQKIKDAKSNIFSQIHSVEQSIFKLFTPIIKLFINCLNNGCQGDISMDKTNMEIFDEKLNLIDNNYNQLLLISNKNYKDEAELALNRINDKSNESDTFINDAKGKLGKLNSQIPYTITETILNIFEEPETNYSMARLKRDSAESFLRNAEENYAMYKFNSAIKNSNDSIAQSREGMIFANTENSKTRHVKNWVLLFGVIAVLFLIIVIKIKQSENK